MLWLMRLNTDGWAEGRAEDRGRKGFFLYSSTFFFFFFFNKGDGWRRKIKSILLRLLGLLFAQSLVESRCLLLVVC